jgi:hypothetical protein
MNKTCAVKQSIILRCLCFYGNAAFATSVANVVVAVTAFRAITAHAVTAIKAVNNSATNVGIFAAIAAFGYTASAAAIHPLPWLPGLPLLLLLS